MVTIGTAVFRRIVEEAREQVKEVLVDVMCNETVRFGGFTREYNEAVAEELIMLAKR